MQTKPSASDADFVYITLRLSSESNELLTIAAGRSARSKRKEAELRLSLHLKNNELVSSEQLSGHNANLVR
ncbi:TraY domain-containing protein [Cedecea sp. NFIX57]|nr:TraY domain-containing protein [Cedecea sp. NFIX57]